jgi:surface carbohydrate biosynthesis protein (TIGR04326 family)
MEESALVLLDKGACWNNPAKVVAHWSELSPTSGEESVCKEVDARAMAIKKEYLAWVYDLGRVEVEGQPLTKFLQIGDRLSFWWMTLKAEKSTFKSPGIYQVFKLRALESIYEKHACKGLIYCGGDAKLHCVLEQWCRKIGHPYQRNTSSVKIRVKKTSAFRKMHHKLPYGLQALGSLLKKWFSYFLHVRRAVFDKVVPADNPQITVVTFFPNIDLEKAGSGRFYSHYWEELHKLLDRLPISVNWVWLYFSSKDVPYREAVKIRNLCNSTDPEKYKHYIAEEFLTLRQFLKALGIFLRVYSRGLRLRNIRDRFQLTGSNINFFPLMEWEWKSSLFGPVAMDGALRIAMFESMAQKLRADPLAIYTWENQAWEMALLSAWRKYRPKAKTIAYQHSFARSTDLRQFFDPRVFEDRGEDSCPLPNRLAVNGSMGIKKIREASYPMDRVLPVEALRYFYFEKLYGSERGEIDKSKRTLLVTTGSVAEENKAQLRFLSEVAADNGLEKYGKIVIKAHPGLDIKELLNEL